MEKAQLISCKTRKCQIQTRQKRYYPEIQLSLNPIHGMSALHKIKINWILHCLITKTQQLKQSTEKKEILSCNYGEGIYVRLLPDVKSYIIPIQPTALYNTPIFIDHV